jgi:hypothetical protein
MRNQFTLQIPWSERFKLRQIRDGRRGSVRAVGGMKTTGPGQIEPAV